MNRLRLSFLALVGVLVGCVAEPAGRQLRGSLERVPAGVRERAEAAAAALQPCLVRITTRLGEKHGVVIRSDGIVLTCAHGSQAGEEEAIRFADGRTGRAVALGGSRDGDFLALRIVEPAGPFPAARLAAGATARDWAFLVSLTRDGRISRLAAGQVMLVDFAGAFGRDSEYRSPVLVIDAPGVPGQSGAPLLDARGEVVGIASMAGVTDRAAVLVAASARAIRAVLEDLVSGRSIAGTDDPGARVDAYFAALHANGPAFLPAGDEDGPGVRARLDAALARVEPLLRTEWRTPPGLTTDRTVDGFQALARELEEAE